jgi:protein SCO1/2
MFIGSFSMLVIFMMANVVQLKRQKENKKKQLEPEQSTTKYTGKADIGGKWMLYNTKGEPVTSEDFAGKYYLIYFGFTFCPDVCPVSLMKMSKALNTVKKSKEANYFDIEALFVSVDPDRDSNERIEEYCKIFDPSIIGLTHKSNTNPELKEILRKFKIHVSKILLTDEEEEEDMKSLEEHAPEVISKLGDLPKKKDDKYTLDHSIIVYLIGPDNQFLTYLGSNLDEGDMANLMLDEISNDLKRRVMPNK